MRDLRVRVTGVPRPQGSKVAGVDPRTGKAFMRESSDGLASWRRTVQTAAMQALVKHGPTRPLDLPCEVVATFYLAHPKSHYGTGRNADRLKPSAPMYPVTRAHGDGDKLFRAVGDALTDAAAITDDSLIVDTHSRKRWAGEPGGLLVPGVILTLTVMPGYEPDPREGART